MTPPPTMRRPITTELTTISDATLSDDDDSAEESDDERGPLRRCALTRTQGERARMLRFVVGPDGGIVPDLAARLPGRGIWLSASRDVLQTACKKGAFPRAAKRQVTVGADLVERVEAGLAMRLGELLGLTRRAGQSVCGFAKAREWITGARAGLVVQASDGSDAECLRLLSGASAGLPVVRPLTAERLGVVFGRDHVVHVAVAKGRLAEALGVEAERLAGLAASPAPARRGSGPDAASGRRP